MFAHDWDDPGEDDDHLPFEERGWVKRLDERTRLAREFDQRFPDFFARCGRAIAEDMQNIAIQILLEER